MYGAYAVKWTSDEAYAQWKSHNLIRNTYIFFSTSISMYVASFTDSSVVRASDGHHHGRLLLLNICGIGDYVANSTGSVRVRSTFVGFC